MHNTRKGGSDQQIGDAASKTGGDIFYREAWRFHELEGFCNVHFKDTDYVSLQVSLSVASRSAVRLCPA